MKRVRRQGTDAELAVRRLLTALGAHYRLNVADLPGSPDIASKRRKKAVFVHGCFWHAHATCRKHSVPRKNREYWVAKFAANVARDARKVAQLEAIGYAVMVVWQCELAAPDVLTRRLAAFWQS
jgi:DNA mismatch endonuclease (patch repair protein)